MNSALLELKGLLGSVWERGAVADDNYAFGRITTVEHGLGDKPARVILTCAGSAQGGQAPRLPLGLDELRAEWTPLPSPPLVFVAPSSCCRCRRMNFGPCISATCVDLQALWEPPRA